MALSLFNDGCIRPLIVFISQRKSNPPTAQPPDANRRTNEITQSVNNYFITVLNVAKRRKNIKNRIQLKSDDAMPRNGIRSYILLFVKQTKMNDCNANNYKAFNYLHKLIKNSFSPSLKSFRFFVN